jgi:hypothetical protein
MDPNLKTPLVGAGTALFVLFFNWCWTLYTQHRTKNRIRTMIRLELDDNIKRLRAFMDEAETSVRFSSESAMSGMQRADALMANKLPSWNHRIWDSLTQSIPLALKPREIEFVYSLYNELDELTRMKTEEYKIGDSLYDWSTSFMEKVSAILEAGNPLNKNYKISLPAKKPQLELKD